MSDLILLKHFVSFVFDITWTVYCSLQLYDADFDTSEFMSDTFCR